LIVSILRVDNVLGAKVYVCECPDGSERRYETHDVLVDPQAWCDDLYQNQRETELADGNQNVQPSE
jgi:hypothetical protein